MTITHEPAKSRFVYAIDDQDSVLEYAFPQPGTVDFYRTYVPPEHRGHGIAEALVDAGLTWARTEGLTIEASCWYVNGRL